MHGPQKYGKSVGNIGPDRPLIEPGHFDLFDRLPFPVRKAISEAPYSLAVREIVEFVERCLSAGMDSREITETLVQRLKTGMDRQVKQQAEKLYGPEHPQAKNG
jgi:hypothetical protein